MPVSGTGIQLGTKIASVDSGSQVTLSLPAAQGAISVTFSYAAKGDILSAFITADARLS
jgi:hypothetical protein